MGHSMRQYSEINDTAGVRKSSTRAKSKARILRKSMRRSRFMAIILTKYEYAISAYFRLLAAVSLLTWTWYTVRSSLQGSLSRLIPWWRAWILLGADLTIMWFGSAGAWMRARLSRSR